MESVLGQIDPLALILACLPMSKHKLGLQLVSRTWKEALETPAAHSPNTHDCELPFAGHGMSKRVTQVLSQCNSQPWHDELGRGCDDWLGPGLQKLTLHVIEDGAIEKHTLPLHLFESLPIMPHLDHLDIYPMKAEDWHQCDLSRKFPSLKTLFWGTVDGEAPSSLENLSDLMRFKFHMSWTKLRYNPHRVRGQIGVFPRGCEIILSISEEPSPIPEGLICQITQMIIHMSNGPRCWPDQAWQNGKPIMDFGSPVWPNFSQATGLKSFELNCGHIIVVRNIGVLPRSCKRLEFCCINLQPSLKELADNGFCFEEVHRREHYPFWTWVLTRD